MRCCLLSRSSCTEPGCRDIRYRAWNLGASSEVNRLPGATMSGFTTASTTVGPFEL